MIRKRHMPKKVLAIMDPCGDENELTKYYRSALRMVGIDVNKVKVTNNPNLIENGEYDVLLFDWGGMSIGNSLLETFVERIFERARNCPDKHFVMLSRFTSMAMSELKESKSREVEALPHNIFGDFDSYYGYLAAHPCEATCPPTGDKEASDGKA